MAFRIKTGKFWSSASRSRVSTMVIRPTGKGRVERQVAIVREHVLAGRSFDSLAVSPYRRVAGSFDCGAVAS